MDERFPVLEDVAPVAFVIQDFGAVELVERVKAAGGKNCMMN
jgi:hypothetical protein